MPELQKINFYRAALTFVQNLWKRQGSVEKYVNQDSSASLPRKIYGYIEFIKVDVNKRNSKN